MTRRGIAGLLAANGISMLGTRMSMLAIPWFVLTTTGSAAETGIVAWRVAIASELSAGCLIAAVPLLHFTGHLSLPVLAVLVAIAGAVRGAGDTGNRVLVPASPRRPAWRSSGRAASSTARTASPR